MLIIFQIVFWEELNLDIQVQSYGNVLKLAFGLWTFVTVVHSSYLIAFVPVVLVDKREKHFEVLHRHVDNR